MGTMGIETAEREFLWGGLGAMDSQLARSNPDNPAALSPHPNEMDRRRIERALKNRRRYRYVTPEVRPIADGYEIVSACCSRNIDPEGGMVDIARLLFRADSRGWELYRKDHRACQWVRHGEYPALPEILELLKEDPDRRFWQ
jgi:hypothetical protein